MHKSKLLLVLASSALVFTGCNLSRAGQPSGSTSNGHNSQSGGNVSQPNPTSNPTGNTTGNPTSVTQPVGSDNYSSIDHSTPSVDNSAFDTSNQSVTSVPSSDVPPDTSGFSILNVNDRAEGFTVDNGIYTITATGEYTLSGSLINGQIIIDVGESTTEVENEVTLVLNGVTMTSSVNSLIWAKTADKVKIKSAKGTQNIITDGRKAKTVDDDAQGEGAIYAKCDLNLTGKGTLIVSGSYNNGIHTSKDLKIKNSSVKVTAVNNAIKGNNSVTISEAATNILAISTGGDGIKTEDSDISSKGNQKGTVTICGGTVNIYSYSDGIDAAYDAVISSGTDEDTGEVTIPTVNIWTNKYSDYSDGSTIVNPSTSKMYLRASSYSSSYRYALKFYNGENVEWVNASYEGSQNNGRSTYYYYSVNRPSDKNSFIIYYYSSSQTENSESNYTAKSSGQTVNTNYDTCKISVSGSTISSSGWTNYSTSQSGGGGGPGGGGPGGGGGMQEGNSDKADGSAKGIKAANSITISDGVIYAKAYDDTIHANADVTLDTGVNGVGDVTISGGVLTLYASDDALHADRYMNISGGNIQIDNSYEGIEGNVINISGGTTWLYASDDGLNAANKSGLSPAINISGGRVDVTVGSGDVDGIDSNGTFTQTGGIVVTKGPAGSSSNNMATGLDCDGTAKITAGTFIYFGNLEKTPTCSLKSASTSGTYSAGTWTLSPLGIDIKLTGTYYKVGVYSDQLSSTSISMAKAS